MMKRLSVMCACGLAAAILLSGCSSSSSVQLGEYLGLPVNVASREVTDDEVEAQIQSVLDANPDYVEVDRAAQEGDTVNIDYTGTQDGVEFAGGSGTDEDLELGSGRFIEGFEDGLIGAKKGETRELDLTFPEDYQEESLAGQPVTFEVTVNAVKEEQEAQLNDAFVQKVSDANTVAQYRAQVREELETQRNESVEAQKREDVLQMVIDGAHVTVGRNELSARYNEAIDQYTAQAKAFGTSLSQMAQSYGTDEGGFKEMVKASVEDELKRELVIQAVADQEGLTPTEEDQQAVADLSGMDYDTMVSAYGQETVDQAVLEYTVSQFLADNAIESELPPETEESEAADTEESAQETSAEEETEAEESAQEETELEQETEEETETAQAEE